MRGSWRSSGNLSPLADLLHTVVALVAMLGMLAAAIVATRTSKPQAAGVKAALASWILVPWAFWVLTFIWGMLARGSARVG